MKPRLTLAIAGLLFMSSLSGQQITRAEYYFNTDPGQGSGTALTFAAGDSVNFTNSITIPGNLPQGINTIYFRTANSNGVWSFSESSLIWINTTLKKLKSLEYFFDTDPGLGGGTVTSFTPADSINMTQNIVLPASLHTGLHLLFTRVKNEAGVWSFPEVYLISIQAGLQKIIAAEYFIDTDPGWGAGTAIAVSTPADSVNLIQNITIPALSNGSHKLYVRTKNQSGTWSFPEAHTINICNAYGPVSGFSTYIEGNEVFFTDTSINSVSHKWNYGDNTSDTLSNPHHIYAAGNTYAVQLITNNSCGADTLTQNIAIAGIHSVTPSTSPETGLYLGFIRGVGFKEGSSVKWTRAGLPDINADTTIFVDSTTLKIFVRNRSINTGLYNLVVNVPGNTALTKDTVINVIAGTASDIWVKLEGRRGIQVNTWSSFNIVVGNNGNREAVAVPVIIKVPKSILAKITIPILDSFELPAIKAAAPEGRFYMAWDSIMHDSLKVAYMIIPNLEAGMTTSLSLDVKSSSFNDFYIKTFVGNPLYNDTSLLTIPHGRTTNDVCDPPPCVQCMMDVMGLVPSLGCVPATFNFACSAYKLADDEISRKNTNRPSNYRKNAIDLVGNFGGWVLSCFGGSAIESFKKVADIVNNTTGGISALNSCFNCIPHPPLLDTIKVRFSLDPNEKTGPSGYNTQNYTRWQDPFDYSIHFENIAAATAPAREVVITDYLDTTKLDLSTLKFTGYGFADTSVRYTMADSVFQQDIDLRPAKNSIVRVTAKLDSVNKVTYRFATFDPATMKLTTSINDGFLNPNTNGTEGLGYVSFQIRTKPGLTTGTIVSNYATVTFDNNAPITTALWINGIDKQKPASNVLPITEKLNDTTYIIRWAGSDTHAGIYSYSIWVSDNNAVYSRLLTTDTLSVHFTAQIGHTYRFYSIAEDWVGNIEDIPGSPDQVLTVVLPVTLVDFSVYKQDQSALLRWSTVFEQRNKGFEVEKSIDGIHFTKIGWVPGVGNSNTLHTYSFIDASPAKGMNFYRLRQLDIDGHAKYSDIRKVDFGQTVDFSLFPNPVTNILTIRFTSPIARIRILDMEGRILSDKQNIAGTSPMSMNVSHLANGSYMLEIDDRNGNSAIQKFIKN